MSRKTRKSLNNANNINAPPTEEVRFLQINPITDQTTCEPTVFSVGATEIISTPVLKPKSSSVWARLFGLNKKGRKESLPSDVSSSPQQRQSFWQRSKSIINPRTSLDRSKSIFIDLPNMKIIGSGSAAQLLCFEDKFEYTIDLYGMLNHIFEENDIYYRSVDKVEDQKEEIVKDYEQVAQINEDGLLSPATTTTESQEEFPSASEYETGIINTFSDDPKLDSPLQADEEFEYSHSYDSSSESQSMESAIRSFISGEYSLGSAKSYSTDEIAEMFGLMSVSDRQPEILSDGTVRCLVEGENGSVESIRFQNCWEQSNPNSNSNPNNNHHHQSEDNLKMKEIKTSSSLFDKSETFSPDQSNWTLKQRSQSLAFLSKVSEANTDVAAERRRSLGAKVSQIVAMYENVSIRTPK